MPTMTAQLGVPKRIAARIAAAAAPDGKLMRESTAASARFAALRSAGKTKHFDACCTQGAWTDAALALVAHELPGWSVRRLVRDDELWICTLSRTPNLPIELDEGIEASHEDMALAILAALVEVTCAGKPVAPAPQSASAIDTSHRLCCDNFS